MSAVVQSIDANAADEREQTDGFQSHHRCAQAQRPEDDLRRAGHSDHGFRPHGAGRRHPRAFVPPRAERRLRRLDRGLPDQEARRLPHRLGARLPQRPDRAGARHHQLLPDDPDLGLVRARDRRPAAGRLRRDGPARHRKAAVQGRVPRAACRRHRHRARACDPRRRLRTPGRRLSRSAGKTVRPGDGRRGRHKIAGQGDRRGPRPDPRPRRDQARARRAEERKASADHPRQGRGLCAGRRRDPQPGREKRHSLPADEHGQGHCCPTPIRNARGRRARRCSRTATS